MITNKLQTKIHHHGDFEPFGEVPIDERWRPGGCESDPDKLKIWEALTENNQREVAWINHKLINPSAKKSEFDFKSSGELI